MKIPFYISLSLLLIYVLSKMTIINFDVSQMDRDGVLIKILGGAFLISILMYSLENESIKKTFENAKNTDINIRKVLAFSLVIGFVGSLFFTSDKTTIDAAKEVTLVVLSFYFGAESKKSGKTKSDQKDNSKDGKDSNQNIK